MALYSRSCEAESEPESKFTGMSRSVSSHNQSCSLFGRAHPALFLAIARAYQISLYRSVYARHANHQLHYNRIQIEVGAFKAFPQRTPTASSVAHYLVPEPQGSAGHTCAQVAGWVHLLTIPGYRRSAANRPRCRTVRVEATGQATLGDHFVTRGVGAITGSVLLPAARVPARWWAVVRYGGRMWL